MYSGHPDFVLRRGPGSILLAMPAFLPSVISSFFTQNNGGSGGKPAPLGPSPRSATGLLNFLIDIKAINGLTLVI